VHDNKQGSGIIEIQNKINNRPRKRLNYLTSHKVFVEKKKPEDFLVPILI